MMGLGWELTLGLMGGLLVLLMGIGVPVAFAFLALNLLGPGSSSAERPG